MCLEEYKRYKRNYNDLIKMKDLREYMIQEFVVRNFLQRIMPELDVIPTHAKLNDISGVHDYRKYCGIGQEGKTVPPDLCIAKSWQWNNDNVDYRALVEVKTPLGVYKFSKYKIFTDTTGRRAHKMKNICIEKLEDIKNADIREELKSHTQINEHKLINKVIFTDGIAWLFIEGEKVKKRYDLGERLINRHLDDDSNIEFEFEGIEWLPEEKRKVDDLVVRQMFDGPIYNLKAPKVFEKLIGEIRHFCGYDE